MRGCGSSIVPSAHSLLRPKLVGLGRRLAGVWPNRSVRPFERTRITWNIRRWHGETRHGVKPWLRPKGQWKRCRARNLAVDERNQPAVVADIDLDQWQVDPAGPSGLPLRLGRRSRRLRSETPWPACGRHWRGRLRWSPASHQSVSAALPRSFGRVTDQAGSRTGAVGPQVPGTLPKPRDSDRKPEFG